jgi:hypothetical protein
VPSSCTSADERLATSEDIVDRAANRSVGTVRSIGEGSIQIAVRKVPLESLRRKPIGVQVCGKSLPQLMQHKLLADWMLCTRLSCLIDTFSTVQPGAESEPFDRPQPVAIGLSVFSGEDETTLGISYASGLKSFDQNIGKRKRFFLLVLRAISEIKMFRDRIRLQINVDIRPATYWASCSRAPVQRKK